MRDDNSQPKVAFEERVMAILLERYGALFDLSPEEAKALQFRVGLKPDMDADEEQRALNELAKELSALKKKH